MKIITNTIAEPELEAEIEGFGGVYISYKPFDIARQSLNSKGIRNLITPRDLAYARQQVKRTHSLNRNGSYTSAGFAYAKEEPVLLTLNSPLSRSMKLARQATKANRQKRYEIYFSTPDLEIYELLAQQAEQEQKEGREPEKRKVLILPSRDDFYITKKENWEVMQGVFKDQADSFLDFNEGDEISTSLINAYTVDSQDGTILIQLWLYGLSGGSALYGSFYDPRCTNGFRGLLKKTGEASPRLRRSASVQVKSPYTLKQLDAEIKRLGRISQGRIKLSDLESEIKKTEEFLKGLKQ